MPVFAPEPICSVCGVQIVPGSIVVYDHHELTHVDCHNGILTDVTNKVVVVLARHPDEGFCHACLADELNIAHDAVQKAIVRLRTSAEVNIRVGECSRCQRPRVTVRARRFERGRALADD